MGEENQEVSFKLNPKIFGVLAICSLFILSLYLWTLPFQKNPLPFGEGDSAWHFSIGDHISSSDEASFRLPYYVGAWYYGFNSILGPFAPEYPPSNHVNYALIQDFSGGRFIPFLIYRAIASFLGVFAVFFIVSRLFGTLPGFIAGLGLVFSIREQLTSMFGQQPTLTALIITPVTTYAWYMYLTSFLNDENKKGKLVYLFMTGALLASQYMLHLQGFTSSIIIMAIFTAIMALQKKKLPISKANWKPIAVTALALLAIVAIFAPIYLGVPDTANTGFSLNLARLTQWGISPSSVQGSYPPSSVLFSSEFTGALVPFIGLGIILLLVRLFLVKNNSKEIFMLSWLIGTYIILHLDVLLGMGPPRIVRMLVFENYLFFSLIAITIVWLPQTVMGIIKLDQKIGTALKAIMALALVAIIFSSGFNATKDLMSHSYSGIERITPVQAEFAADYINKLPEKAFIYDPILPNIGGFSYTTWRYPKMRWMLAISQRYVGRDDPEIAKTNPGRIADLNEVYVLFDYSDIVNLASASDQNTQQMGRAVGNELNNIEVRMFNNTQPIYNVNNIRLYKYIWKNSTNTTVEP